MRCLYLLLLCFILNSCTEEDKYPDIPLFEESLLEPYDFEEIDYSSFIGTANGINFFSYSTSEEELFMKIIDVKTNCLIKSIPVNNARRFINENGDLYFSNDDFYDKYEAPSFNRIKIPYVVLEDTLVKDIEENYKEQVKGFSQNEKTEFLYRVSDTIIKEKYFKGVHTVFPMSSYEYIFKTKTSEFAVMDEDGIYTYRKEFFDFNEEQEMPYLSDETLIKSKHLEKFDEITLGYRSSSGNHFAFKIISDKLRYYNFELRDKKIQFKTSLAVESRDYEGNIVLEVDDKVYKIMD